MFLETFNLSWHSLLISQQAELLEVAKTVGSWLTRFLVASQAMSFPTRELEDSKH